MTLLFVGQTIQRIVRIGRGARQRVGGGREVGIAVVTVAGRLALRAQILRQPVQRVGETEPRPSLRASYGNTSYNNSFEVPSPVSNRSRSSFGTGAVPSPDPVPKYSL